MHRPLRLAVAVTVVLGAAACGGDDGGTSTTRPTAAVETSTTVALSTLEAMLLDTGDVGAAWTAGHAIGPEDLSSVSQVPCPDTALNPVIAGRLTARTGVQFDPVDHSDAHLIELLLTGAPSTLGADLAVLAEAQLTACPTPATTTPGGIAVTVETWPVPAVGEQRWAFAASAPVAAAGPRWYVRTAIVRAGSVAVFLSLTEIQPTVQEEPHFSDGDLALLIEAAVAKLPG